MATPIIIDGPWIVFFFGPLKFDFSFITYSLPSTENVNLSLASSDNKKNYVDHDLVLCLTIKVGFYMYDC